MSRTAVLIVEDEAIVAADLAGKLRQLGYEVAGIAATGKEAAALCSRLGPHLVLMDISLAGPMDGIQAAEAIRNRQDIPVIYLTAHSDRATLDRAKVTEPFGYILKPFEERDLATQIELALYKHQADRQLREQREWLRVTLNSIGDAVIATDAAGRITFINPVAESLTGWRAEDAIGRPIPSVFRIVNEQTGEALEEPVAAVLRAGRAVPLANHTALVAKDGRRVPIEDSAAPITDAAGRVIGVVLVFHDVTAKRRSQEALRRINETLERRVAERSELAEARARQLQTLAVELIEAEERERRRVAELLHEDLQQILAAARMQLLASSENLSPTSMLANVARLLEESIDRARRLSHELSPAVLHYSGLPSVLEWLASQMKEQFGLQVELDVGAAGRSESEPLKVFIFRAVQELLFNVVKHADVKSARVVVSGSNGVLAVTVSDKGRGFNPERLNSSNKRTGLGLLSLRERASYIGGGLAIESTPGAGSRFTLTVPLGLSPTVETEARDSTAGRPAPAPAGPADPAAQGNLRVLLADDHKVMREGLISMLSDQPGIQVVGEAADGQEALERALKIEPDVVVMDISMPVMDGVEASRRIKAVLPEVRVIGLTMHADDQLYRTMRMAGAEAVLSKTASATELLKAIYGIPGQGA